MSWSTRIRWTLSLILGALFIWSASIKLLSPADFSEAVYRYQILPSPTINLASLWVPWVELFCALSLWHPRWRLAGATIVFGMLLVFTAAILSTFIRGIDISCGCFSVSPEASEAGLINIVRNLAMLTAAGGLAILEIREQRRSTPHSQREG